jgi:aminomethyltransferase
VVAWDKGDFIGKEALAALKEKGVSRRLVGFKLLERGIPRQGYPLHKEGEEVGVVTSGTMSPSLGEAIGMGYVRRDLAGAGTELEVLIRNKPSKAQIVKRPFIKPSVKR